MNALKIASERWGEVRSLATEGRSDVLTQDELDRELAEFLRREQEEQRNGFTKRALHSAMQSLDGRYADHEKKDDTRHDTIVNMVRGLEARMTINEAETRSNKSDIAELKPAVREAMTSVHDITEQTLEERLSDSRAAHKETMGRVWQVVFWVVTTLAAGGGGALIARAMSH